MKKLFLLFCLLPIISFGQKIIINDKEDNRPLTWEDFTGKVNKDAPYAAMTYSNLGTEVVNADAVKTGETPKLRAVASFLDGSWANRKKELNAEVLKHEQGHFNITIICAAELQKQLDDTTFTNKTFRAVSSRLFQVAYAKMRKMQADYDRETNHSRNKEEQAKWNAFIETELARYEQLSSSVN